MPLYVRSIAPGNKNTKNTIQKNMTMVGGYTTLSIVRALSGLYSNREMQKRIFSGVDNAGSDIFVKFADSIINKAKEEIKKRGDKPHEFPIPIGSKGTVFGISVTIDGYG